MGEFLKFDFCGGHKRIVAVNGSFFMAENPQWNMLEIWWRTIDKWVVFKSWNWWRNKKREFSGQGENTWFFSKRGQGADGFFWYFLERITEGTGRGFIFWRGHAHWGVRRRGPGHHWFVKDQQPQILWKVGCHFPPCWERTAVFPIKRTSAHHRFYLRHALAAGHSGESSRLHLQWHERPCWSKLSSFL